LFKFILNYSFFGPDAWLFCIVENLIIRTILRLLYIPMIVLLDLKFFLDTSQEIGYEEHLQNDPFCIEWDVKP